MEIEFIHNDTNIKICLNKHDNCYEAIVGENKYSISFCSVSKNCYSFLINKESFLIYVAEAEDQIYVKAGDEFYCFTLPKNDDDQIVTCSGSQDGALLIKASMPGNILKIHVKEGQAVQEGQCLAIVEAMKMETELCATINGIVQKIHATPGNQVNAGDILIELEEN